MCFIVHPKKWFIPTITMAIPNAAYPRLAIV
jgi:hypothetical protein